MVGHTNQISAIEIKSKESKNAFMKVLISPNEGWEDYVMRVIEVKEEGVTPLHSHPWPHINYIIEGKGQLMIQGETNIVTSGSYAFVPSNTLHQFKNIGKETFKFICIVPKKGHII
ncbi:MAG: cupin domain-containing protein [Firmicutes bacterium]|nr:cupin domain-containing protein [Bacillota bacterium]